MSGFRGKMWLIIAGFLVLSLLAGAVFLSIRLSQLQPVEISLDSQGKADVGSSVYIGGAVARPGIYQLRSDDTLSKLITSAGMCDGADAEHVTINVPSKAKTAKVQKVNLNRAELWLLQALPGIGEGKAALIVDYRTKNGPLHSVDDLLKIQGFGPSIVDKVRDYATVVD